MPAHHDRLENTLWWAGARYAILSHPDRPGQAVQQSRTIPYDELFSHALPFLADPYFVAGTAVPDWLAVVDRGVRVKAKNVEPLAAHPDRETAAVARGLLQHFRDDSQFHKTRAFAETTLELSAAIRRVLAADSGFRPSFLGHVLVEVLLDWTLAEDNPGGPGCLLSGPGIGRSGGRAGGGQPHVGPRHRSPGPHDFPLLPGADLVGLRPR